MSSVQIDYREAVRELQCKSAQETTLSVICESNSRTEELVTPMRLLQDIDMREQRTTRELTESTEST